MTLDPIFLAVAIPAVLISGLSKGGFGGGLGFVSTPLLALVMDPGKAAGLMLPLLMLMDLGSLPPYWRKWSWPEARRLMVGMVPGVVVAALTFRMISADGVRLMVGGIAVGFVVFQILRDQGWLRPGRVFDTPGWGHFWGAVTGFTSFASHAGGPPASMYLLATGLDKLRYQATTVVAFWWCNAIKVPPYLMLGMFDTEGAKAGLMLAPVALAGVAIGVWAHNRVSETWFFRVTYVLLLATGLKLIWDALT